MPTIEEKVAKRLAEAGKEVEERVIDTLIEATLVKRTDQIATVMAERERLVKEGRRLEAPDSKTFNRDGTVAGANYSEARIRALKENKERIEKIDKAVDSAVSKNDYSSIEKLGGKGKPEDAAKGDDA